jgi:hydrogenase small subunit
MDAAENPGPAYERIGARLRRSGVSRREFLDFTSRLVVAAPFLLPLTQTGTTAAVARRIERARRVPVIWLHFQDCTGCSETLLRATRPDLTTLIFDVVNLVYHETLMVAAGHQAEEVLEQALTRYAGEYIVIVEGSVPQGAAGQYMTIAGKPATEILPRVARDAAAVIALGSCSSFGGLPAVRPNPTDAVGVGDLVKHATLVNIPGCPPNPYILMGTVLQYAHDGTLPALDLERRPRFAFDRVVHEHCPRRPHFDAGRFATQFGDEGHRQGWCLYELGCKGPETHAGCSTRHFNDVVDAWPIGIGAPCVGCTEKALAFNVPMFQTVPLHRATPPSTYAPVRVPSGALGATAVGLVGLAVGGALGATYIATRSYSDKPHDDSVPVNPVPDRELPIGTDEHPIPDEHVRRLSRGSKRKPVT